ncbi:MAG TPA: hypothetical protein VFE84_05040 [Patescibacteria group bacterium]|nr:hypothetical protein [Patescibacteria group bacterium]
MSRKEKREERLINGDDLLEQRGIDLEAPDDSLLPLLLAAIGSHPDADLSIADYLGSIPMDQSATKLLAWEDAWEKTPAPDKDLLRVIRRSLFRLQQRGIAAAAREKPAREPVRLIDPVEPTGYLSPIDGAGNRLAWLSRPRPEGGLVVMTSVINDRIGMRDIGVMNVNKARLREIFADAAKHSAHLVPAPHRYVDWLMNEAYRVGVPKDDQGGGYPLLRAEFYIPAATTVPSPVHALMNVPASEIERLLDDSASLFNESEFFGWALPDETVKVFQARFRDAQDSTLVLSKETMTERLTAIIDEAFDETVASESRPLYATRMQEMALWYHLVDRQALASSCYAVHLAMADPQRSLKQVSFLRALVFRSFIHLMPSTDEPAAGKSDDPSTLIVRPD